MDLETQSHYTNGGRVIASTALGIDIEAAVDKAYSGIRCVQFEGMQYRKDIAHRALRLREKLQEHPKEQVPLTYASAGVSIAAGNSLVERIKPMVKSTARPGADASIGGFGGEVSLRDAGYGADAPTIVCAIDGIGTKIIVAKTVNDYSTIGIDLVAMNVNDLLVQGAAPLAFLDYYACSNLVVDNCAEFVKGVAAGCKEANCALVGGETAEMPGIYRKGDFDAAGCAIGVIPQNRPMLPMKNAMKEGDVLLGLASNGPHSNGYSLIRKIVDRTALSYDSPAPWDKNRTVGQEVMTPTRIYVRSLLSVLEHTTTRDGASSIKGLSHITGGGLLDNIPRMLPKHLSGRLSVGSWPVPKVLNWLKQEGKLEPQEFARSFNTGLGMVCVVDQNSASMVQSLLEDAGETVYSVGELITRGYHEGCILRNIEVWR